MWKRLKAWLLGICDHGTETMLYEARGLSCGGHEARFGIFHCGHCDRVDVRRIDG
jgi:hypothetical protein